MCVISFFFTCFTSFFFTKSVDYFDSILIFSLESFANFTIWDMPNNELPFKILFQFSFVISIAINPLNGNCVKKCRIYNKISFNSHVKYCNGEFLMSGSSLSVMWSTTTDNSDNVNNVGTARTGYFLKSGSSRRVFKRSLISLWTWLILYFFF